MEIVLLLVLNVTLILYHLLLGWLHLKKPFFQKGLRVLYVTMHFTFENISISLLHFCDPGTGYSSRVSLVLFLVTLDVSRSSFGCERSSLGLLLNHQGRDVVPGCPKKQSFPLEV